jgi:hypothetical protein
MRFCLLLLATALASGQVRDVYYQGSLTPLNTVPTFDHGYLTVYDHDPDLDVYGPDGTLLYKTSAHGPNGIKARIDNAVADTDGTVAAAVGYSLSCNVPGLGVRPWQGGGIAFFDRSGGQTRFIDTGCDYWTTQVAFGPDHSVWAIGWLGSLTASLKADYLALRHYTQTGEPLGASLPRASFPHPDDPHREPLILPKIGLWDLQVTGDHVEIILDRVNLWVETDLKGQETARWSTGPNFARPRAFTADGLAWRQVGKQIMVFNRSSGAWSQPILEITEGLLIGADGNDLIFLLMNKATLRRVPEPPVAFVMATAK